MINCLIIDDEIHGRNNLKKLIETNCPNVNISGCAENISEGIKLINEQEPQLLFLDIEMPDGKGFDLLQKCENLSFEVIFVTAYDHYAINAIKFSAIDYILKPIDELQLIKAVNKALHQIELKAENKRLRNLVANQSLQQQNQRIALPFVDAIEFIEVKHIIHLEAEGSYTKFHLSDGIQHLVSGSLKEFEEMLRSHLFIRTHQAHLVNSDYIKSFVKTDGGYLKLNTGEMVPVSRLRKNDVLSKLKGK